MKKLFIILLCLIGLWLFTRKSESKQSVKQETGNDLKKKIEKVQVKLQFGKDPYIMQKDGIICKLSDDTTLKLLKVEHGSFIMGKDDGHNLVNEIEHEVTLTRDFYLGETEVTEAQYETVTGHHSYTDCKDGNYNRAARKNWEAAMEFCDILNKKGCAPKGWIFTLPTEAQWEYAASGGKKTHGYMYSGSNDYKEVCAGDGQTVATKKPNELGFYDMSGSVAEHCLDDFFKDSRKSFPEFLRSGSKDRTFYNRYGSNVVRATNPRIASRSHGYGAGFRIALVSDTTPRLETLMQQPVKASDDSIHTETIILPGNVPLKLIRVEHGTFTMSRDDGSDYYTGYRSCGAAERNNKNEHPATLTHDFYLGETEVTVGQYKAIMGKIYTRYADNYPISGIKWNHAMSFCEKLNKDGYAPKGWIFTLPTETQWEYAASGGEKTHGYTYSGSNNLDEVGWCYENSKSENSKRELHPVGTKKANELGFYDMSGNIFEWCLDDYSKDSRNAQPEFFRANDQDSFPRVYRGGDYSINAVYHEVTKRPSEPMLGGIGFRVALVPVVNPVPVVASPLPPRERTKIADHANAEETVKISLAENVQIEFIKMPHGSFVMSKMSGYGEGGDYHSYDHEHSVTLDEDFYLGKTEVTQKEYQLVTGTNPSIFSKGGKYPVENVSWFDAMKFCEILNEKGYAPKGWKFSLPTEAQWEYAAAGGTQTHDYRYSGSNNLREVGWFEANSNRMTHPVGIQKANELGFLDMSGNVCEWCLSETKNTKLDQNTYYYYRGGSWSCFNRFCHITHKEYCAPDHHFNFIGFRVALIPEH